MKKKEEDSRRTFLKQVLTGAAVVGAATIISPTKAKSASMLNRSDEILYHESESFKKYYKTLRS
jgi:hypothetical protein